MPPGQRGFLCLGEAMEDRLITHLLLAVLNVFAVLTLLL